MDDRPRNSKGQWLPGHVPPTAFKKGEVANPKGRPRSVWNIPEGEEVDFSKQDLEKMLKYMSTRNREELKAIVANPKSSVTEINVATAIINDIKAGKIWTLDSLWDRMFGKPKQTSELEGKFDIHPPAILIEKSSREDDEEDEE